MTPYLFVDAMVKHKPITLFNGGAGVYRDWTYVDDIVAGVVAALPFGPVPAETDWLVTSDSWLPKLRYASRKSGRCR